MSSEHPKPSSFHFLPLMDLQPSNIDCVYSTLVFIKEECKKIDCYPVVTFDQPLCIKAMSLTKVQDSDVGHVMKGSGLEGDIGQCYSELTVRDILKGKAFNRAIRAHSIVHRALYHLLLEENIDSIFSSDENILLNNYYDRLADCEVADLEEHHLFERLIETIHEARIEQTGATSQLWLQYLEMVDILFELYRGERTGNLKHILPYLAAGD